jgi:hypothetical protein
MFLREKRKVSLRNLRTATKPDAKRRIPTFATGLEIFAQVHLSHALTIEDS